MCLMLQGIRFQVQVLKPCKSVQESSDEVLIFKSSTISLTASIYRGLKGCFSPIFDSCLIDRVSIKIYENHILVLISF